MEGKFWLLKFLKKSFTHLLLNFLEPLSFQFATKRNDINYFLNISAISFAYLFAVISSSDSTITLILLSVPEGLTRTLPTVKSDSISLIFFGYPYLREYLYLQHQH